MNGRRYGTRRIGTSTKTRRGGDYRQQKPMKVRLKQRKKTAPCGC